MNSDKQCDQQVAALLLGSKTRGLVTFSSHCIHSDFSSNQETLYPVLCLPLNLYNRKYLPLLFYQINKIFVLECGKLRETNRLYCGVLMDFHGITNSQLNCANTHDDKYS